jgi:hypothetical protein
MKKIICLTLIILTLVIVPGSIIVSASFGSGVEAIANEVTFVKSGLLGKKLAFSDTDIKQGLCIGNFDSITITKLPSSNEGTLMLLGRRVGENQEIKRKNIPSLLFIPASAEVSEARFKFTVAPYESSGEFEFILKFTDKINYEPKTDGESTESAYVKTQRDICIYGKMHATDPEGDALEFTVLSYPEGMLTLLNKATGEYKYTPIDGFVGEDSFSYVARDLWGNYSKVATVQISVSERMSEVIYTDMTDRSEYSAAVALTAMGIMDGKLIGDNTYFNPDTSVSRAEFVTMAMKAVGMRPDSTLTSSFFDDNDEIPEALVGYIATAQRVGIINGKFTGTELIFSPNTPITKYEAAKVMAKLLNLNHTGEITVFNEILSSVPLSAREEVYCMYEIGVFSDTSESANLSESINRAECAKYLYKISK